MKQCTKCKSIKSMDSFSTNSRAGDGLHSWCRDCVNYQRRKRRDKYAVTQRVWCAENKDKLQERDKLRRLKPEYKLMKSESDRRYRENNTVDIARRKKAYYAERPDLRRAEYQRNKQGYVARAYQRKYKIKLLTPDDADRAAIQRFYDEARDLTLSTGIPHEVDHIVPISAGGLHHHANLQILTRYENRKKGARTDAICSTQ